MQVTTVPKGGFGDLVDRVSVGVCSTLLGTITATIASWLVQQVADKDEASQAATRQQVAELTRRIDVFTELLTGNNPPASQGGARPTIGPGELGVARTTRER